MSTVLLVRHGQAGADVVADYDRLSERGAEQARVLGAALRARGVEVDQVVTGSLRRQRETAEALLPALGAARPARVVPGWDEFDHVDLLAHHAPVDPGVELQPRLDAALRGWIDAGPASPCEPPFPAFRDAALAALGELTATLGRGRTVLVVTSGGVVAALAAHLLGAGAATVVALNRVAVNTAVTTVLHGRSGSTLLTVNEHAHLPRELATFR